MSQENGAGVMKTMKPVSGRRGGLGLAGCGLALLIATSAPALAAPPDQYILHVKPGADLAGIESRHGLQTIRALDNPTIPVFLVQGPTAVPADVLENEVETEEVEVENIERVRDLALPELNSANLNQSVAAVLDQLADKSFSSFYGSSAWNRYLNQAAATIIELPQARPVATGAGTVAVIDTGIDPHHPVLAASIVPGYDFVRDVAGIPSEWADVSQSVAAVLDQTGVQPEQVALVNQSVAAVLDQSVAAVLDTNQLPAAFGHGTMVAGVIHLVAPTATIMPLKAFKADGTGNSFDIVRAIYYAVDNGAKVINMSFSLNGSSEELVRAVNYATERKVVCVASAGNTGREAPMIFPAAIRSVMGVAATSNTDVRSTFSNYGNVLVHVAAPGEAVITTFPGANYAGAWGTSFSGPFVAGTAALLNQLDVKLNQYRAADDIAHGQSLPGGLGYGRLDVYEAVTKRSR